MGTVDDVEVSSMGEHEGRALPYLKAENVSGKIKPKRMKKFKKILPIIGGALVVALFPICFCLIWTGLEVFWQLLATDILIILLLFIIEETT